MSSQTQTPALIVLSDIPAKRCGAGWFPAMHAVQARERAKPLGLMVIDTFSQALLDLAKGLPQGRFEADGKLSLDLVDREMVDRVLALGPKSHAGEVKVADAVKGKSGAGPSGGAVSSPLAPSGSASAGSGAAGASPPGVEAKGEGASGKVGAPVKVGEQSPAAVRMAEASRAAPAVADLVDALWSKVAIGSLVIAPELGQEEGWWEAVVVDVRGKTLTLRWRNYEELGLITRKLKDVALLHPKASIGPG